MADYYKAVLVPERHQDEVEAFVAELEQRDEFRDRVTPSRN